MLQVIDDGKIKKFINLEKPDVEQLKDFYEKNKDTLCGYDFNMMFYKVESVQETKEIFNQMKSDGFVVGEALSSYVYGLLENKNPKNSFLLDELISFTDEQTRKTAKGLSEIAIEEERTKALSPVFKIFIGLYETAKRDERLYEGTYPNKNLKNVQETLALFEKKKLFAENMFEYMIVTLGVKPPMSDKMVAQVSDELAMKLLGNLYRKVSLDMNEKSKNESGPVVIYKL